MTDPLPVSSLSGSGFWVLALDFKWHVTLLCFSDSEKWSHFQKLVCFVNFNWVIALLSETNSFLIGHKELHSLDFWIHVHLLWPLNTLASSLGIGWCDGPWGAMVCSVLLTWGVARALGLAITRLWVWEEMAFNYWLYLVHMCDTWRDKRDLPALNWNLSFLLLSPPGPISSLPPSLHCDDLVGMSVTWTNASSDYNLLIVVYNENCKLF